MLRKRSASMGPRFLNRGNKDRKSTRLNSSHSQISYAVFCLKKKKTEAHLYPAGGECAEDEGPGGGREVAEAGLGRLEKYDFCRAGGGPGVDHRQHGASEHSY